MMLVLALLAASPVITDETGQLNATQRADLFVASDELVAVLVIDSGSVAGLHERAAELRKENAGRAVVVFDTRLDRGTIEVATPTTEPHERAVFAAEIARLGDSKTPVSARLLRAVGFASSIARPREPAEARPLDWRGALRDLMDALWVAAMAVVIVALKALDLFSRDRRELW